MAHEDGNPGAGPMPGVDEVPSRAPDLELERAITGRIVSTSGQTDTSAVTVWFAYRGQDGAGTTVETVSGAHGEFAFAVPSSPLRSATIGAVIEGVRPVDLGPDGTSLEPGDVVLLVDDIVPSHLRYGC